MKDIKKIIRPNIVATTPRCDEPQREDSTTPPQKGREQERAAANAALVKTLRGVRAEAVMYTAGAMSPIDIILRSICTPGRDNIIVSCPPTPQHSLQGEALPAYCGNNDAALTLANINAIDCRRVALDAGFRFSPTRLLQAVSQHTQAIVIAAPAYPSGMLPSRHDILYLADHFEGLIVIDETYSDYTSAPSFVNDIPQHPNIVIVGAITSPCQPLSSAAVAFTVARPDIITALHTVGQLYPIIDNRTITPADTYNDERRRRIVIDERGKMLHALNHLPLCEHVYPSAANTIVVRMNGAATLCLKLQALGITTHCCSDGYGAADNCLCLPIGLTADNNALLSALRQY